MPGGPTLCAIGGNGQQEYGGWSGLRLSVSASLETTGLCGCSPYKKTYQGRGAGYVVVSFLGQKVGALRA